MKKAFTLVEIIIVIVIFALLSGAILRTYTTITKIAFRIEQDKELAKEVLILSQVLHNIAEEATIYYEKYQAKGIDLKQEKGITDTLYLTWGMRTGTEIASVGDCEKSSNLYTSSYQTEKSEFSGCKLLLTKEYAPDTAITLLWNGNINQSKMKFKVIPYLPNNQQDSDIDTGKPGFRILGSIYSAFYNPQRRENKSVFPIQLFLGLQGKTPNIYDIN